MLRILILGGTGMLGHQLCMSLSSHNVSATVRTMSDKTKIISNLFGTNFVHSPDVMLPTEIIRTLDLTEPDVVINAIGAVKQHGSKLSDSQYYSVNGVFPWKLATICTSLGVRLVHVSTDCVFDGTQGNYSEENSYTATDVYGQSKALGEVFGSNLITFRTSIIGFELTDQHHGLLEWYLRQDQNFVPGYINAYFSGLTTEVLANEIDYVISESTLNGIFNIGSTPINKFDLLTMIRNTISTGNPIEESPEPRIDRTLDSSKYWSQVNRTQPTWQDMMIKLRADYEWRADVGLR